MLLTLLKFLGIAVGGVSGVSGTLTKTHEEKMIRPIIYGVETRTERKLTLWGKVSAHILPHDSVVKLAPEGERRYSVCGYFPFPSDTNITLVVNPDESFFELASGAIPGVTHYLVGTNVQTIVSPNSLTNEFWLTSLQSETHEFVMAWKDTARILTTPDIDIEFTRKGANPDSSSPDLTISGHPEGIRTAILCYSPDSGKLTFNCYFSCSSDDGGNSQTIRSIAGLAEATPRISTWFPFGSCRLKSTDCLRQVSLGVQGGTLILTNFRSLASRDDSWVEATTLYGTNIVSNQFVH